MKSQNNQPVKKRLLFVITQGFWGGAQKYVYDLATKNTENFNITVIIGGKKDNNDLKDRLVEKNNDSVNKIKIIELDDLIRPISPFKDIKTVFCLYRLYRSIKPDIIHLNSSKAGIVGSIAKLLLSSKKQPLLIYTAHGWVFNEPLSKFKKWLYKNLEKVTAKIKDRVIVLSKHDYELAKAVLKIPENKLNLVYLGSQTETILHNKEEILNNLKKISPQINPKAFLILCIANLFPTKGLSILIEAVDKLPKNKKEWQIIIIGDGPEKEKISKMIKDKKLEDKILLLGFIKDAYKFIPAFDLFVLSSLKEGTPYTLIEALNYYIPIIATNVGGIPELLINQPNCFLVTANNSTELSNKLEKVINHPIKYIQQKTEGQKKFSIEEMIYKTKEIYCER